MRGWLATLRTELRHGMAPWAGLAVTLTVVALLWLDHTGDWGGRWNALGSFMRELVIVLGPVCLALGVWQGGRARRAGVEELLAATRRTRLQRTSAQIVALAVAISIGVLLGWASAAWTIVMVGGWGTTAAAFYVVGLLPTVLAYTTVGFAIGTVVPWRIAAPITGAAAYVGLGLLAWQDNNTAVPMGGGWLGGTDGFPFDLDAWTWSIAVLLLTALACWAVASVERRPAAARNWVPLVVAGVLGAGVLYPVGVQASDSGSPDLEVAQDLPMACTPEKPEVCVFAWYQLVLPETVAQVRPILQRLQPVPGAPTRAIPTRLAEDDPAALGVDPGQITPWGEIDREYSNHIYVAVRETFWPASYCPTSRYGEIPPPMRRAFRAPVELVVSWIAPAQGMYPGPRSPEPETGDPSSRDLYERFEQSTAAQRSAFAGQVLVAARNCDSDAARAAVEALAPAP